MTEAIAMAETRGFGSGIVEKVSGQRASGIRPSPGRGPVFLGSRHPLALHEPVRAARGPIGKREGLCAARGRRDAKWRPGLVVAHIRRHPWTSWTPPTWSATRRSTSWPRSGHWKPVLPLDYRSAVAEATDDPDPVFARGEGALRSCARLRVTRASWGKRSTNLNAELVRRALTSAAAQVGQFLSDGSRTASSFPLTTVGPVRSSTTTALPVPSFPGLEPMRRLGAISPKSDEARQIRRRPRPAAEQGLLPPEQCPGRRFRQRWRRCPGREPPAPDRGVGGGRTHPKGGWPGYREKPEPRAPAG